VKKHTKNYYVSLIMVILCLAALVTMRFLFCSRAWGLSGATLYYTTKGETVSVELERKDWAEIARMFNFNVLEENRYRCPVSEELCIKSGNQTFYIAEDGCDMVEVAGSDKCFETGKRDRLWEILKKYGAKMG